METAKPGDSCTDKSTPVNLATIVFPKEVDGKFGSLATGSYVIKNMPVGQTYTKFFYLRTDQAKETWSRTSQNNFNVVVEASGNIRVVEVKGSGSYQYQAGFTATGAKCQDTQVWKREYYLDFQQYKVYTDGSTVLIPNSRFAVLQSFELVRKDSPTPPWHKC
ncbi:hypothetical protein [Deinococcus sp.]|uniref:hypothetical protein n=1 Tax=Deinococcus sp. TaxID=47478 RepID=UPI0025B7B19F|nr:hypothetical protein [Deinococcus sp.]